MTVPTITPLPTPPSRADEPAVFTNRADEFLGSLPDFATEANAVAAFVDDRAAGFESDGAAIIADVGALRDQTSTLRDQAGAASSQAGAQATLAGHYANDATDTDVPGGAAGERGAKYWANLAMARATAALAAVGIGIKAGSARFVLYFSGDKSIWFDLTPTAIKHVVIDAMQLAIASLQALFATISAPAQRLASKPGPDGLYLYGQDGKVFASITRNGINHPDYAATKAQVNSLVTSGVTSSYLVRDSKWDSIQAQAEINHIEGPGQSEMQGYPGGLYTTTALSGSLMFSGGVRPDDLSTDPAVIYATLTALQGRFLTGGMADTTANDSGSVGETPMIGAMKMLRQLLISDLGTDPATNNQQFLCSVSARGGASVTQLMNGGVRYPRTKANIQNGPLAAKAAGKAYRPLCVFGAQGIGDIGTSMTAATWKSNWLALLASIQSDWQSAAGTTTPIPMIFYQTCSAAGGRYNGAEPIIPIAQLQLALENDYIAHTGPTFFMPYRNTDVHFVPQGTEWLGAYYGWVLYQWLIRGYKPPPFRPVIRVDGNQIVARYPVLPGRKLVADTSLLEAMPNLGMQAFNASGVEQTLSNARFAGTDCVVWDKADGVSAANWYFGYAWRGQTAANKTQLNGGNLRDDNPLVFDPSGLNVPMYRWAPIDKITVTA